MFYIIFAVIALVVATKLLWSQYRKTRGTPSHAKRGAAILTLSLVALLSIEYGFPPSLVTLIRSFPLFVVHLAIAVLTLSTLCALCISGAILFLLRDNRDPHSVIVLICRLIHHALSWFFPCAWAATIITGLMFFIASVRS